MWQKQLYNLNKVSRESCAECQRATRADFYLWRRGGSNAEEEELPWIETRERRERKTARGRATAPNLNKTNEYITGLFYVSPNGFTPWSNTSVEPDTVNMEGEEEAWQPREWIRLSAAHELQTSASPSDSATGRFVSDLQRTWRHSVIRFKPAHKKQEQTQKTPVSSESKRGNVLAFIRKKYLGFFSETEIQSDENQLFWWNNSKLPWLSVKTGALQMSNQQFKSVKQFTEILNRNSQTRKKLNTTLVWLVSSNSTDQHTNVTVLALTVAQSDRRLVLFKNI